jgi:hypothetical protein
MNRGKLQYRQNVVHVHPYFMLLRIEVESLALELRGANGISILKSSYIDDFRAFAEFAPIFLSDVFRNSITTYDSNPLPKTLEKQPLAVREY